jgi:hypothetical protein
VHVRLNQRSNVLEKTFAQLRVVGINLASALGCVEHQAVFGVSLFKQLIYRWMGNALGKFAGGDRHKCSLTGSGPLLVVPGCLSSAQGYQRLDNFFDRRVDKRMVEFGIGL